MRCVAAFVWLLAAVAHSDENLDTFAFDAADAYYDPAKMTAARDQLRHGHGDMRHFMVMVDQLEFRDGDDENAASWDIEGWYGGDINKLWIKAEGDYSFAIDQLDTAQAEILYARAISPYFDVQAGLRYDIEPDGLAHGVLRLAGLAPYWFELDAAAYLSEDGDLTAAIDVEYEWLFTQSLVMQFKTGLELAPDDVPARELAAGFTHFESALRLRYELRPQFAPYLGVEWSRALGDTADLADARGEDDDDFLLVVGLRVWF